MNPVSGDFDNSNSNSDPNEKYRNLFEVYFKDSSIDLNQLLAQTEEQLIIFIKETVIPSVSEYPPQLRKELEKLKLIKKQTYKELMNSFKKPTRTDSETKLHNKILLSKLNPIITKEKVEKI